MEKSRPKYYYRKVCNRKKVPVADQTPREKSNSTSSYYNCVIFQNSASFRYISVLCIEMLNVSYVIFVKVIYFPFNFKFVYNERKTKLRYGTFEVIIQKWRDFLRYFFPCHFLSYNHSHLQGSLYQECLFYNYIIVMQR